MLNENRFLDTFLCHGKRPSYSFLRKIKPKLCDCVFAIVFTFTWLTWLMCDTINVPLICSHTGVIQISFQSPTCMGQIDISMLNHAMN
jgi:hypothetical protein